MAVTAQQRRVVQTAFLFAALLPLSAQNSKPADTKCKPGTKGCPATSAPDSSATKPPASSADFAFPLEDSRHGADAEGAQPAAPAAPAPATQKGRLPDMPTEPVPDPPASSQEPMRLPPGSSSSGDFPASSSSSRSTEDDDVAPTTASPDSPVKASALKDLGSKGDMSAARARLEITRVEDDLKVGRFYMKDGNAQGAYLRFKDAVGRAPDDPEVRFNLAEAAAALNKREEAVAGYQETLRLDPGGDHDKAARKALGKLGSAAR